MYNDNNNSNKQSYYTYQKKQQNINSAFMKLLFVVLN